MDRAFKLVASAVIIVAMLGIGTGLVMIPAYKLPETNYLALGMILLNQNGGTTQSITGLDSETIAKIENQALTREEIPEIKDKIQNRLNQGFQKWAKQNSIKFTLFNATSETVTPLFFQFLEENPRYKEAFKLHDQVLAQENDFKMQELTKTILAMDTNYVVQNGELLNEWNTTSEVNGTTYTSMFKEYSLDVNGTTLTVVKVTIMSSDGTVIVDPYLYVHKFNLFYLTFVIISWWPFYGIYVPCYYGWDIYSYTRFSNDTSAVGFSEAEAFLANAKSELDGVSTTLGVYAAFCFVTGLALLATPAAPAAPALEVMSGILGLAGVVASVAGTIILNEYLYAAAYNYVRDPTFGICTMDRHHIIYASNPYEFLSWSNFHVVYCDGGVKQISPFPVGVYYYEQWWQALTIVNLFTWINSNYGFEHWVWLGPYVPPAIFG